MMKFTFLHISDLHYRIDWPEEIQLVCRKFIEDVEHAYWSPSEESIEKMRQQVSDGVAESTLPIEVKDAIADESYDRSKPYKQEIVWFIRQSSLIKLVQAMRGAARALRNSDHVEPTLKKELLQEVMNCWIRVSQILVVLSPILAKYRIAFFEGMGFILGKSFDKEPSDKQRWQAIMSVLPTNVVDWFQQDIFSKKLGALLSNYTATHQGALGELLVLLMMTQQRPPGWEREIERFIVHANKNSFYLCKIYESLFIQFKTSFSKERTRQQLRRLAAMSIAKHHTGVKHPNIKLVEKAAKSLDHKPSGEKQED